MKIQTKWKSPKIALKRIVPILLLVLLLGLFYVDAKSGDNSWTSNGPFGAEFKEVVVDPTDDMILYATTLAPPTVYKSIDGGETWFTSSNGLPDSVDPGWMNSFVIKPGDSNTLFIATDQGIYKSTNAGQSWVQKSTLIQDNESLVIRARAIAVSSTDGTLFAGGYEHPVSPAGGAGGGIFRSKDDGESWERLNVGSPCGPSSYPTVENIAIAPSATHIVYAVCGGIFKSVDGGDSWNSIDSSFAQVPGVQRMVVDPNNSQVVYISLQGQGMYKTTNGGQSWFPIGVGLNMDVRALVIDPDNQQILYAGGGADYGTPGVYRSLDNRGENWTAMMEGMGSRTVWGLAMDRSSPQNIYAATSSGIWKYTLLSSPQDYSVSINDGALFTNQTSVTLSLTAPPGTTDMIISNDGGFAGASWETFKTTRDWTISSYGEYVIPRVVYTKFRTSGQTSGEYQDDIILDVTPPIGSIEVMATFNGQDSNVFEGAANEEEIVRLENIAATVYIPIAGKNFIPGFRAVELLLSASDNLSGVGEMMISNNDPTFANGIWESFQTQINWLAEDTGSSTIYAKFRDRAGNESVTYSDVWTP